MRWLALLLVFCTPLGLAAQPAETRPETRPETRMSSERVTADPSAQYVLIKTLLAPKPAIAALPAARGDPEGYDLAGHCWATDYWLGDWAERAGLAGRLATLAMETLAWSRELERSGYPAAGLSQTIGRYEADMVAAGATDAARERGLKTISAELEALRRTTPGAVKTRITRGCGGLMPRAVQLRYRTVPKDGRAWFVPKLLHEICRAQQLDSDDSTRCDYWMESKGDEPRHFVGETMWLARWPDGVIARGEFDPRSTTEPGIVTLRQIVKK
jgi:hypothetical protein